MKHFPTPGPQGGRRLRQSGFTIVEMMVALAIGLFVVIGFTASFVNMKTTFKSQDSLSQLQDNERLAMTVLGATIQEAGYYPTGADLNATPPVPPAFTDRSEITGSPDTTGASVPSGSTMATGQYIFGTPASATTPQTLSTAYVSNPGDGVLTCQGGVAPASTADMTIRNIFYVDTATNTLGCRVLVGSVPAIPSTTPTPGSAWKPLISNVKSMNVVYGIDADGDGSVDSFLNPDQLTPAQWDQVKAVRVTLVFIDPFAAQTGQSAGITWIQTINLMNNK